MSQFECGEAKVVDDTLAAAGAWCPVSLVPFPDGTTGRFPHIIERGKPGIIGVPSVWRRYKSMQAPGTDSWPGKPTSPLGLSRTSNPASTSRHCTCRIGCALQTRAIPGSGRS